MTTKTKTITLVYTRPLGADEASYRVTRITDSTEFFPNEILGKRAVNELCGSPRWKVTIMPARDLL